MNDVSTNAGMAATGPPAVVIRPSRRGVGDRLRVLGYSALAALVVMALVTRTLWTTVRPFVIALDLALLLVLLGGLVLVAGYSKRASLFAGPGYLGWTGAMGRRIIVPTEGLDIRRAVLDFGAGGRQRSLLLVWPAAHRLSRVPVDLYAPEELQRWMSYLNRPVTGSFDREVAYEDIGEAYEDVFGKPRLTNYWFLVLIGSAAVVVTLGVMWIFLSR